MTRTILLSDPHGDVVEAPFSRVHAILEHSERGKQTIRLAGDRTLYEAEVAEVDAALTPRPVTLPAQHDWLAVYDTGERLAFAPVLAWRVDDEGGATPVTPATRRYELVATIDPFDNTWSVAGGPPVKFAKYYARWWRAKLSAMGITRAEFQQMLARAAERDLAKPARDLGLREAEAAEVKPA
jgi:hypothetical protein